MVFLLVLLARKISWGRPSFFVVCLASTPFSSVIVSYTFMRKLAFALLLPVAALANDCRFILADQSNWFANSGFYINLESSTGSSTYCPMAALSLDMGVGDGSQWRFIWWAPAWVVNHDYTVTAVIAPDRTNLYLDGKPAGEIDAGFAGLSGQQLISGMPPYGDTGASDYLVSQSALTAQAGAAAPMSSAFPAAQSAPLTMLAPGTVGQPLAFTFTTGDTLTITAVFRLTASPSDPKTYAPYIDTYGQSLYASFPGKIHTDADLQAAAAEEQTQLAAWGMPTGYDAWGGVMNAGWQDTATGFFHVVQHNGVWWLVSPAGNPCFYIGLDTAPLATGNNTPVTAREWEFATLPPQRPPYNSAWNWGDWGNGTIESASFDTWNLIRKYGDTWQNTANNLTVERMQTWGFSGFGKWSSATGNLPIMPVLFANNVPVLVNHPDIFDPQVQAIFQAALAAQIQGSINDPSIVGWSYTNEYDGIITPDEISAILANGAVPAKRALIDNALSTIYGGSVAAMAAAWGVAASSTNDLYNATPNAPPADIETLREYYADQFYAYLYQTVKSIDPNHLYFGFWIVPGWWVNQTDWQLIAAHVDVIGYDRYSPVFQDSLLESLARSTARPIFLGEYSFPPHYTLVRGYQVYPAAFATDDAQAGAMYQTNLESATRNPWCVGVAWFEYRDEPVSGRGFYGETDTDLVEGENYAFGMVDVADRPKYDLVNQVRTANLAAAQRRLAFAPPALNAGGTVNNASFASNPVAPGSLVSVFGTGLAGTNQTALALGGFAMPLYHTFPLQIDAQVPWELAGQAQAPLSITTDDLDGNTVSVPLAPYSPGIYSANGTGAGQGAILINGTTTLASPATPAQRGDYINVFATGLGPVSSQPATGAPAPTKPLAETTATVTATIAGLPAPVSFAGLAPGWVGLYQVNVQIPATAPTGDAVPIALSVGGAASNQVTIAIR